MNRRQRARLWNSYICPAIEWTIYTAGAVGMIAVPIIAGVIVENF